MPKTTYSMFVERLELNVTSHVTSPARTGSIFLGTKEMGQPAQLVKLQGLV